MRLEQGRISRQGRSLRKLLAPLYCVGASVAAGPGAAGGTSGATAPNDGERRTRHRVRGLTTSGQAAGRRADTRAGERVLSVEEAGQRVVVVYGAAVHAEPTQPTMGAVGCVDHHGSTRLIRAGVSRKTPGRPVKLASGAGADAALKRRLESLSSPSEPRQAAFCGRLLCPGEWQHLREQ